LRTKPRNLKYKAKLRARVEADSIEAKALAEVPEEMETEAAEIKSKTTKTKGKTPCQYCDKLFVNTDKHESRCKKNPNAEVNSSPKSESIAIKA
jgi:hypothetical protein